MNFDSLSIATLRNAARRIVSKLRRPPESIFGKTKGVIHIGAHRGQERDVYAEHNLNVIWIEAIPEIFSGLQSNIAGFPKQKAFCRLLTDVDDKEYTYHISNNDGESSSILDFEKHKEIWPDVTFNKSITLKSNTLSTLIKREGIDLSNYDALVLDTQGSELLILKGAGEYLRRFRFIRTEVADFIAYRDCCQLPDMDKFLSGYSFRRIATDQMAGKPGVGSYFNVTYSR